MQSLESLVLQLNQEFVILSTLVENAVQFRDGLFVTAEYCGIRWLVNLRQSCRRAIVDGQVVNVGTRAYVPSRVYGKIVNMTFMPLTVEEKKVFNALNVLSGEISTSVLHVVQRHGCALAANTQLCVVNEQRQICC